MNLEHLKNGNGFINKQNFFDRMSKFMPPTDDYYIFRKIKNTNFSEVGVVAYGAVVYQLFKVWTGNKDVYSYLRDMFHEVAEDQLKCKAKSKEWRR